MPEKLNKTKLAYRLSVLVVLLMMVPIWFDYLSSDPQPRQLRTSDIFFIWIDGKEIAAGVNPYSKIHNSDMLHNQKYSTYLPGFFLLEVLAIKLGISDFDQFFPVWQFSVTVLYCLIGLIIFQIVFRKSDSVVFALFAAMFWLLSRWSFSTLRIWQIDFLAILLLLLAYAFFYSRKRVSLLLLGCSLAVKQIAVFAVPFFLLHEIRGQKLSSIRLSGMLNSCCLIALIPFLVSAPFLYADFSGFLKSIIFSVTRNPGGLKLETIDQVFGIVGISAKLPLLLSLLMLYWLYFRQKMSLAQGIFLSFLAFVSFNSVLFKQYLPWFAAFAGIAAAEQSDRADNRNK